MPSLRQVPQLRLENVVLLHCGSDISSCSTKSHGSKAGIHT